MWSGIYEGLYSAALAGSASALDELSFVSDRLSDAQLLDLFPIILRHINRKNIPKDSNPKTRSPDTRVRLALSSLTIVRRAQWQADVTLGFRDVVVRFCRENWLTLWAWVELFGGWVDKDYVGTREGGLDEYRQEVYDMVLFFFADVAPATEYESLLDSVPFLVPMMARIWLLEAASPVYHRRMNFIIDALRKLLSKDSRPPKPTMMQRFIRYMEASNYEAVTVLLDGITRLSKQAHTPYFHLGLKAALHIVVICSQDSDRFFRSLLARRSTPIFASVMADLTSPRRQTMIYTEDEMSEMELSLEVCTGYFLKCCDSGPTWVAEAIEGRLIISIFKSRRFLSPKPQILSEKGRLESRLQVLFVALLNSIRAHLLYPFILQGAIRSIKTVESRGLELDSEKNKDLWESWTMLKDEALRRRRWKSDVYIPARYNLCSNKKCPHPLEPKKSEPDLRKMWCSRCHTVIYCSRKCQKDDWKDGHRLACDLVRARRRAGFPDNHTHQVLHFLETTVHFDILEAREDIKALLLKHEAGRHPSDVESVLVKINYGKGTDTPFRLSISPESDHEAPEGAESTAWARLMRDTKITGHTVVYVTIPAGKAAPFNNPTMKSPLTFILPFKFGVY